MSAVTSPAMTDFTKRIAKNEAVGRLASRFRIDRFELLSEIYFSFLSRPNAFLDSDDATAYVARVARNAAVTLVRRGRRFVKLRNRVDENQLEEVVSNRDSVSTLEQSEVSTVCRSAIDSLPSPFGEIAQACLMEGLSVSQFAIVHNINLECAKTRRRRAKSMLKQDTSLRRLVG